jgi:hypothetical protein
MTMSMCVEKEMWNMYIEMKCKMDFMPFVMAGLSKMAYFISGLVKCSSVNAGQFMGDLSSKNTMEKKLNVKYTGALRYKITQDECLTKA